MTVLDSNGFVYRDGDAFAIYHATLHRHGGAPKADIAIGLGTWSADDAVAETSAFLAAWTTTDEIQFGFVDPSASAWQHARLMANQLSADQGRTSDRRGELLAVAERIVSDDPAVRRHLA